MIRHGGDFARSANGFRRKLEGTVKIKLKGKVKKQYVIKYQSKERYLNKGNKTFYIPPFQIYEHSYESLEGDKSE